MFLHKISVAPMMDWTDRHCRYFHRILSKNTVLYTEMVTAQAIIHGDRDHLLAYHSSENPLVLQIGGSDPELCAKAISIADEYHYDEFNLNVGCPSDRVQSGRFGACLMYEPDLVTQIILAMRENTKADVSVKCRLGVDDQDYKQTLPLFIEKMQKINVKHIILHARKAWLKGLSPKENRSVPPLDYEFVHEIKKQFPDLYITINGGIENLQQAQEHLCHVDGVMIGRSAYHNPCLLMDVDREIYQSKDDKLDYKRVIMQMNDYIMNHPNEKFYKIAKHLLGFRHGVAGARKWRQMLTEYGTKDNIPKDLLLHIYYEAFGDL